MSAIEFKAQIETIGSWAIVKLPGPASATLPSRSQVMVNGTINGCKFLSPLEPDGVGGHWLSIDKNMQKSARIQAGDAVTLTIEPTKIWPEPIVPPELMRALRADAPALATWKATTPMARHEWLRWINSTAQADTRQRRIEVSCSKLAAGERRPCCFNRSMCCVPDVSKNGVLLTPRE
jgi:hypothetical protein